LLRSIGLRSEWTQGHLPLLHSLVLRLVWCGRTGLRIWGTLVKLIHLLVIAGVVFLHTTAFAQSDADLRSREQASVRFSRGVELYQDEAYRAALIEFERAYEISPNYRLLYNIGGTKLQLQDFLGAARAYERYLTEGGDEVPRERRETVEPLLRSLEGRVGRIAVTVNRPDTEVFIDELKIGVSPIAGNTLINVGRHQVSARTSYGTTDSEIVDVAGGEIAQVSLEVAPPTETVTIVQKEETPRILRNMAIIGWGTGGALLVGSLVTGIMAGNANDDLSALLKKVDVDPKDEEDARSKVKSLALTTDVLMFSGIAFATVGTVVWFLDRRARKQDKERAPSSKVSLDVGLGMLKVSGQF
jgi:tetratricopeptide (TPR) repeat protein